MRMGLQPGNPAAPYWLKMYFNGASPSLSKTLPIIENLGLSVYAEEPTASAATAAKWWA